MHSESDADIVKSIQVSPLHKIFAAAGASLVSAVVVNPLDVAKVCGLFSLESLFNGINRVLNMTQTRIQAQGIVDVSRSAPSGASLLEKWNFAGCGPACVRSMNPAANCGPACLPYAGTVDALKRIAQSEGMRSLWRGTDVALLMAIPMVGIYLPLYDYLLERSQSHGVVAAPLIAGTVARTVAVYCTSPFELLRTRFQASRPGANMSLMEHLPAPHRLWTGVGATLARDVPFSALYWAMVEPIRCSLLKSSDPLHVASINVVAGGLSGWIAGAVTTPLDVVKTRTQLALEQQPLLPTLRNIALKEGVGGLFQGWSARAGKAAPACAIVLSSYEVLKHIYADDREE